MKRLAINKQVLQNELIVELVGAIDEDADFKEIEGLVQKKIRFDFNQVTLINSCGIREWIRFIEKIPATSEVTYNNCPQIIIEQINMVDGFIKKGSSVNSFYAPYFCESCSKETKAHLLSSQVKNKKAPAINCPYCGEKNIEFDAIESQYFNFLGKI